MSDAAAANVKLVEIKLVEVSPEYRVANGARERRGTQISATLPPVDF